MIGYIDDAIIELADARAVRCRARQPRAGSRGVLLCQVRLFRGSAGAPDGRGSSTRTRLARGPGVVTDLDFRQLMVEAEYAFGGRLRRLRRTPAPLDSAAGVRPAALGFGNQGGLGDLRAGAKVASCLVAGPRVDGTPAAVFPDRRSRRRPRHRSRQHRAFAGQLLSSRPIRPRVAIRVLATCSAAPTAPGRLSMTAFPATS